MTLTYEEKAMLCKHKNVYEIYVTDGIVNVEKRPVVYINQFYVYIKRRKEPMLQWMNLAHILRDVSEVEFRDRVHYWVWEIPKDFNEIKEEMYQKSVEKRKEENRTKVREQYLAASRSYAQAKEWYEAAKKAYEKEFGKLVGEDK